MKKTFVSAIIVTLATACSTFGGIYYVAMPSDGGNNANPGTLAQPWATVEKASRTMGAGDTVYVRGGSYILSKTLDPRSGAPGAPISFVGYAGEVATIDGAGDTIASLNHSSDISFENLRFTSTNGDVGACMFYLEASHRMKFTDCEFFGMPPEVGSANTSVIKCMATSQGNSTDCEFRNNYFHDNGTPGIWMYDTDGWIIENNEFRNCRKAIGGKDEPYNMLVRRNLIVGSSQIAFYFAGQSGGNNVTVTENIIARSSLGIYVGGLGTAGSTRDGFKFYNNTFYNCDRVFLNYNDGDTKNFELYNNACFLDDSTDVPAKGSSIARFFLNDLWGGTPMPPADYYLDYNCFYTPPWDTRAWFVDSGVLYSRLADWQIGRNPMDADSIAADPRVVDATAGDFHLQAGSPCIGSGRGGVDIGAYPRGDDGTIIGRIPPGYVPPDPEEEDPVDDEAANDDPEDEESANADPDAISPDIADAVVQLDGVQFSNTLQNGADPVRIASAISAEGEIRVMDVSGNHVTAFIADDHVSYLDTTGYANGVYFLKYRASGAFASATFIVAR